MVCQQNGYEHNNRCRYVGGFYCEDCREYFPRESATYRRCELPSELYCVVWNIGVAAHRAGEPSPDVEEICAEIRRTQHTPGLALELESITQRAEEFVRLHGQNEHSASITLRRKP